jgi:hypothetical protein
MRLAEHLESTGQTRNVYKVLVVKLEGKRPLGRLRRRWEENNRMYRREIVWRDVDCMHLAEYRGKWQLL